MKINLTAIIFSMIFCFGTFYNETPLNFLLGDNYKLNLICIFVPTIFWFLITETRTYAKIINSRYVFLIFALICNFLMIRSSYSLRELLLTLALLPIIFSRRVGIKNLINILIILNFTFLFLTSIIELINYLGFLDLNNWDASNLPWIKRDTPAYVRTLRTSVCFFNPYFISFMEYIGKNGDCLISDSIRRVNFFWIEPAGVMYSTSFILLSYANGLFKSLRINLFILFLINLLSRSVTGIGSFIIIFILKCFNKISIFRIPRIYSYFLAVTLIPSSVIIFLKIIEIYYPVKSYAASLVFVNIKNAFNYLTLFGDKNLVLSGDYTYDSIISIGAATIPIRYGIVGFAAWLIIYVPFFVRSYLFIGLNNTNQNLKYFFAYSALLVISIFLLKDNSLFAPITILIGEYVQMKFPNER